ncbi:MAG: hypothetical protein JEY99_05980 [Spirochaetales bacterium]|nr:hypothetical protein [Spirochaetales bacterium]
MKKILWAIMVVALLFAFGSCDLASIQEAFSGNVYTDMEPNENPEIDLSGYDLNDSTQADDAATALAEDLTAALEAGTIDARFFEDLAVTGGEEGVNNQEIQVVLTALDKALAAIADDPDVELLGNDAYQELALMQADVALAASGADEVVSNLNTVISDMVGTLTSGDDSSTTDGESDMPFESVEGAIGLLFDTEIDTALSAEEQIAQAEEKEAVVVNMLTGLLSAMDSMESYAATLDADDDVDQTPSGENAGDIATTALLVGITSVLVDAVVNDDTLNEEERAVAQAEAITDIAAALFAEDTEAELNVLLDGSTALDVPEGGSMLDVFSDGIGDIIGEGLDLSAFGL